MYVQVDNTPCFFSEATPAGFFSNGKLQDLSTEHLVLVVVGASDTDSVMLTRSHSLI